MQRKEVQGMARRNSGESLAGSAEQAYRVVLGLNLPEGKSNMVTFKTPKIGNDSKIQLIGRKAIARFLEVHGEKAFSKEAVANALKSVKSVSESHWKFHVDYSGRLVLTDCDARHPTFVNGEEVFGARREGQAPSKGAGGISRKVHLLDSFDVISSGRGSPKDHWLFGVVVKADNHQTIAMLSDPALFEKYVRTFLKID